MSWTLILGLSLILTHEIDAIAAREWRILPGLSQLADDLARRVFVFGHVPLFAIVLWGLTGNHQGVVAAGFDVFLMAHFVAHLYFHRHPENGFRNSGSWILISGAGIVAAVDLWERSFS
ncbi:MAG: hypothetical protein GY725_06460 [bacterium]|nr:hypothetical protein [bacterium]